MDYCISDIHGEYALFCELMDKIAFGAGDRLYVLGDMTDKGPESVRLAKLIFSMPNATVIAGNHEYDFLKYFHAKLAEGGEEDVLPLLRAYFPGDGALLDWETVEIFDSLPYFVRGDGFIGVHAGVPLDGSRLLPPEGAAKEQLVYDRRFKEPSVIPTGGDCVIFGHTPVRYVSGLDSVLYYPRAGCDPYGTDVRGYAKIHIDTGVTLSGVLGCVRLSDCRSIYVSRKHGIAGQRILQTFRE